MTKDVGRSPADAGSGLRPFGAEPAAQSQAEPLVPNAGDWHYCGEERGGCSCMTVMHLDFPICTVNSGEWGDEYPSLRLVGESSFELRAEAYMAKVVYGEIPEALAKAHCRLIATAPDLLAVARMYLEDAERWKFDGPGVRAAREAISRASGITARSDETPQAAQPEGQEPGGEAETPNTGRKSRTKGPTHG